MLWDGPDTRQLSGGQHSCEEEIRLFKGKAAWRERIGGELQVMYWDSQAIAQITQNLKSKEELRLAGGFWRGTNK